MSSGVQIVVLPGRTTSRAPTLRATRPPPPRHRRDAITHGHAGKNPQHHLTDGLVRTASHPMSRTEEQLPEGWAATFGDEVPTAVSAAWRAQFVRIRRPGFRTAPVRGVAESTVRPLASSLISSAGRFERWRRRSPDAYAGSQELDVRRHRGCRPADRRPDVDLTVLENRVADNRAAITGLVQSLVYAS
ncbi:MAG: hypothetical protein IPM29_15020 [Planctomycetes bacterium]|nr:hypothetical protein [Planctomycetota bacterium]